MLVILFQYISCYSLSVMGSKNWTLWYLFQYISCYSLSAHRTEPQASRSSFNTSHVTLYQFKVVTYRRYLLVSIHLMLLFINLVHLLCTAELMFQYISCYSLSKSYRVYSTIKDGFQYISCYSLSISILSNGLICLMFQYISCYSLSMIHSSFFPTIECFNTSHVTLYLAWILMGFQTKRCFNTSHVTLYHENYNYCPYCGSSFNTSHVTLYRMKKI